MTKINLKINNIPVQAEPGSTILEAAREAGIQIPTLCYLKDVNKTSHYIVLYFDHFTVFGTNHSRSVISITEISAF